MKEAIVVFMILLLLLLIISVFGGSVRYNGGGVPAPASMWPGHESFEGKEPEHEQEGFYEAPGNAEDAYAQQGVVPEGFYSQQADGDEANKEGFYSQQGNGDEPPNEGFYSQQADGDEPPNEGFYAQEEEHTVEGFNNSGEFAPFQ